MHTDLNGVMDYCQPTSDGVLLHLRIQPRASRTEIAEIYGESLRIRLQSPALENRANQELILFLAKALNLKKSQIQMAAGEKSRDKKVAISGESCDAIRSKISQRLKGSDG